MFTGLTLLVTDPTFFIPGGPVAAAFGGQVAAVVYGTLFVGLASMLTLAKVLKRKTMHKHALFAIWMTGIFTGILEIVLVGFTWSVADKIVVTISAAYCWLRWKFLTEYIDPHMFYRNIEPLRDDLPPVA